MEDFDFKKALRIGLGILIIFIAIVAAFQWIEDVPTGKICVMKDFRSGNIRVFSTPGWKTQAAADLEYYDRLYSLEFNEDRSPRMRMRFNDGAHADLLGSMLIELPTDQTNMEKIQLEFGSYDGLVSKAINPIISKSIFLAGTLMNSKESYAEKRSDLIFLVEDMCNHGLYRTIEREVKEKDPVTGNDVTIKRVVLLKDSTGNPLRQEDHPLFPKYGIAASNFNIVDLVYDTTVEGQIQAQQRAFAQAQVAVAQAKQAEQDALTAAKKGEAAAMTAKWDQEKVNAKIIAEAEQRKTVAKLDMESAEFTKQKKIKDAEGESEYKRKIMMADGALTQKLDAWERVNAKYAEEFSKQKWVPEIDMSGSGGGKVSGSGAQAMIDMLTVNTAKQLSLDMSMKGK